MYLRGGCRGARVATVGADRGIHSVGVKRLRRAEERVWLSKRVLGLHHTWISLHSRRAILRGVVTETTTEIHVLVEAELDMAPEGEELLERRERELDRREISGRGFATWACSVGPCRPGAKWILFALQGRCCQPPGAWTLEGSQNSRET